jgi:soluble lytic murein transglycosylase-like protein
MSGRFGWSALFLLASVAAASLLVVKSGRAESDVYWYTDEKGVRFYTNMPSDPRYQPLARVQPPRTGGDEKSRPFEGAIVEAAGKYGVDTNLLRAVIKCESNFNRKAVSRAGAQGLMQLMPDTARLVEVSDPFDAVENLEGGARYLKYLLDSFSDRELALAAYNAGEGAVRRHGGIPPYRETQNYVKAVLAQYDRYCTLADGGDVITSEDIQAFIDGEGVRLFTNVPWKYSKKETWKRMDSR